MKNGLTILFLFILPVMVLAQEDNSLTCADGIDNDNDGFIDCEDSDCQQLPNQGCQTCMFDGFSFADTVIEYLPNCLLDLSPTDTTPTAAIGVSDYQSDFDGSYVALGTGGIIRLGFTNNVIVNSGDADPDIWVFEIGGLVEGSSIELKPCDSTTISILINEGIGDMDGDGYFDFGNIGGATAFLEIDGFLSGSYNFGELKFIEIKITDIDNTPCNINAGADIDAVCAISSQIVDCACTPNGNAIIDDCGECLEPSIPVFGWDGTHKGEDMNPAVFVFFTEIILANGQRKIIKGNVLLIR